MARIAFIQNIWAEWLGVMGLSAVLQKHGHAVDIFLGSDRTVVRNLAKYRPDIIAFSAMNIQHCWLERMTEYLRRNNFTQPIIVGGPHPTYTPEQVISLPCVDVICRGEGEGALVEFADAVAAGQDYSGIRNLWVKQKGAAGAVTGCEEVVIRNPVRPLLDDLDALPFPDRELYAKYKYFRNKPFEGFMAGRGCPNNCAFCFNHQLRQLYPGAAHRVRSPENLVEEIKAVQRKTPIKIIYFEDSTFNLERDWLLAFCELFARETTVTMTCNVRLDLLDEETAKALAKARCRSARFAIESGNEGLRNRVLQKNLKDADILAGVELLRRHDIPFVISSMIGIPDETLDMAWETILFNRKLRPTFIDIFMFMPYPNLELTKYAASRGYISEASFEEMRKGRKKMFSSVLRQKDIKEVSNLHKFSYVLARHASAPLDGVVRQLIRLPENPFFDLIFGASYIVENCRRRDIRYSYGRMLLNALMNIRYII